MNHTINVTMRYFAQVSLNDISSIGNSQLGLKLQRWKQSLLGER
jgi:hypothetical protein